MNPARGVCCPVHTPSSEHNPRGQEVHATITRTSTYLGLCIFSWRDAESFDLLRLENQSGRISWRLSLPFILKLTSPTTVGASQFRRFRIRQTYDEFLTAQKSHDFSYGFVGIVKMNRRLPPCRSPRATYLAEGLRKLVSDDEHEFGYS